MEKKLHRRDFLTKSSIALAGIGAGLTNNGSIAVSIHALLAVAHNNLSLKIT